MGSAKRYFRRHQQSVDAQIYRMHLLFPQLLLQRRRNRTASLWLGPLQPAPLSQEYRTSIRYEPGLIPIVRVLAPLLSVRADKKELPHVYPDGSLCLHVLGDWNPGLFIADYIVPWTSTWLFFYEVWYATGKWIGGGTHPEKPEHQSE